MLIAEPLLGTRAEVSVTASVDAAAGLVEQRAFDEVARLEAIFTRFDSASALHSLRRNGSTEIAELLEVQHRAEEWVARTSGAFNPALQSIVDVWDRAAETGQPPNQDDLDQAVATCAQLPTDQLDFNGIAKGWIADRSLEVAVASHPSVATSAWLNVGGDLVHWGEGSLRVGIENPHRPYDNVEPLTTIELSNAALATSGSGRRWWTVGDERFPKVLDPRTGLPCSEVSSASVIARTAEAADVLATAALVLGSTAAIALVEAEGACCLLVLPDRSVLASPSWR